MVSSVLRVFYPFLVWGELLQLRGWRGAVGRAGSGTAVYFISFYFFVFYTVFINVGRVRGW